MFGEFYCEDCDNTWKSGNAWEGKGQQCLKCMKMILPASLRPLKPSGLQRGPPHREDLCEMCKSLGPGRNCRNYKPTDYLVDDDDVSVQSFGSFTTDRSEGGDDITPRASDNEEDIDEMVEKIGQLDLK